MLAHVLHRACGHARAAVRAIRRRLGSALRPATTSSLVLGVATDLVWGKAELGAENALLRQQPIVLARSTKRPRGGARWPRHDPKAGVKARRGDPVDGRAGLW
jgi:hypothetical protein